MLVLILRSVVAKLHLNLCCRVQTLYGKMVCETCVWAPDTADLCHSSVTLRFTNHPSADHAAYIHQWAAVLCVKATLDSAVATVNHTRM